MTQYSIASHLSSLKTDPVRNFKFLVNIPHKINSPGQEIQNFAIGFTAVSGLSITTNSIPYRQGGYNTTVQQIPGQSTFSPVTFQRGMLLGTKQEWEWMKQLFSTLVGQGNSASGNTNGFRADHIDIYVLRHPNADTAASDSVANIRLYNAWPTAVSFSDLNAGDNAFIVSQMTLVHEGFDLNVGSSTSPAPDF